MAHPGISTRGKGLSPWEVLPIVTCTQRPCSARKGYKYLFRFQVYERVGILLSTRPVGGLWNKTDTAILNTTALTMLKVQGSVSSSFWLERQQQFQKHLTRTGADGVLTRSFNLMLVLVSQVGQRVSLLSHKKTLKKNVIFFEIKVVRYTPLRCKEIVLPRIDL